MSPSSSRWTKRRAMSTRGVKSSTAAADYLRFVAASNNAAAYPINAFERLTIAIFNYR